MPCVNVTAILSMLIFILSVKIYLYFIDSINSTQHSACSYSRCWKSRLGTLADASLNEASQFTTSVNGLINESLLYVVQSTRDNQALTASGH